MAIVVEEKNKGRSADLRVTKLQYLVSGTSSDNDVLVAVKAQTPTVRNERERSEITIEELGGDWWLATVDYGKKKSEAVYEFNYQAPQAKIMQSLATIGRYAKPGATAFNHGGAINVVSKGGVYEVEGVDLPSPQQSNTWTFYPPVEYVNTAYEMIVERLQGCVNSAPFMEREAGTLRFVSCQGGIRTEEDWEIRFGFQHSPHRYDVKIGDTNDPANLITVPFVGGHHLLWVRYEDIIQTESSRVSKYPEAAYVEQVFPTGDFSQLGFF